MNCTAELIKGIVIPSAGIVDVGTAINLEALFAGGAVELFDEITVFNDANRPIKVMWTNDETAKQDFFMVPNGGKGFTHKLNQGHITTSSLKIYSIDGTAATGNITINVSKNRK